MALLGTETRSGDFEVADALFAGVPAKVTSDVKKEDNAMQVDSTSSAGWVALISGIGVEGSAASVTVPKAPEGKQNGLTDHGMMGYSEKELKLMLLTDWILGHVGEDGVSHEQGRVERRPT